MTGVKRSRRSDVAQINSSIIIEQDKSNLFLGGRATNLLLIIQYWLIFRDMFCELETKIPMGPKFSVQSQKNSFTTKTRFPTDWTILSFLEIFLAFYCTKIIVKPIPTCTPCVHNSELKFRIVLIRYGLCTSLYFFLVNLQRPQTKFW